ncbi:putative F-box associated domain, type 3, kelch-type beta propeller, F-box-like domain superfamily [Helianthus annuus]|uniref:F-box associated domain, type 3, kelch-type beta propeller, F-box-like domain superfamily n=1 Tax=Helianthus annuus TaxID=4232 RepID=A0A251UYP3_HELAN|nr:putative F-box protein At5g50220 [Helianthus annuus]KAF5810310.1 putative F-box associated domain, type 3, kelch-type beta propeller, F-box-like domain superfamily [Helianthus annuus]
MDSKLPYDMKMEILSRTSLKTLDAIRCSNKEFNKLSYDPCLLNMYKKRNNIVSGLILQTDSKCIQFIPSRESSSLDLSFLPKFARILASSKQGILVLETNTPRRVLYTICKPATKQILLLPPNLIKTYKTIMVAVVVVRSTPLRYKIVRLCQPGYSERLIWPSTYCCEVFDSITWTWRQLSHVTLPHSVFLIGPSITARGSIYILLTNNDVMKFDTYSEEWTTFSSPNTTRDIELYPYRKLVKYEGKLGFACKQLNGFWEFWVLTIDETWEKTYVLNKDEDTMVSLNRLYDSNTSVTLDDNKVIFHGLGDENMTSNVISSPPHCEAFLLRSDFEPVDFGENKCL